MTTTTTTTSVSLTKKSGLIPAIIGCISGVLAVITVGIVFFPIALVCTIAGFVLSIKTKYGLAIGLSCLSLILTIAGFAFSPTLWAMLGLATGAGTIE
ncbi:hypothetical protein MMG00_07820 [Ignatzschineria rhizosphaerae]|uniref:DUF4190 domain-containing protein n=1 Tax=Ignatzschineria rhizosphaerae TaxID=2923279 RepID=A0ABY3WX07_9GAMM|nr:hypothetical protein [Ignatzschineria rhizosphaerae]UNM95141.1 hypothetical protein MMG00_07820 [Ignatzschineria rhizosphaerae]